MSRTRPPWPRKIMLALRRVLRRDSMSQNSIAPFILILTAIQVSKLLFIKHHWIKRRQTWGEFLAMTQ